MLVGTTLQYTGGKAIEFDKGEGLSRLALFRKAITNAGAFAIQVQLAQTQRALLLQHIANDQYQHDYFDELGEGNNASNLFEPDSGATAMRKLTRKLEKFAHYSIGRGRLLDERSRRLKTKNSDDLGGEAHLWDFLHAPLWGLGLNLAGQLSKQGFIYVVYPAGLTDKEYAQITNELAEGRFDKIERSNEITILTSSGDELTTCKYSQLQISMDPEQKITQQKNGFVVTCQNQSMPVGWTIHTNKDGKSKLVDPVYTIEFIRTIRTAQGGSHILSEGEFNILIHQSRGVTGNIRSTENAAINAVVDFSYALARDFDPLPLLGNSIQLSYNRIQASMTEVDVIDDLLTGVLITEMVQSLKKTQPQSTRPSPPQQFSNPFDVSLNIIKAFAYAYDLKKPDGSFVFKADDVVSTEPDDKLVDVRMHGELQLPDLTNPKHVASLIAVGVMVAEQMILEQLLRDTVVNGAAHPNAIALRNILLNNDVYTQLVTLASRLPRNSFGPILGLQIPACDEIVFVLRQALGFDQLIQVAEDLYEASADENVSEKVKNAVLRKLYQIGNVLQQVDSTSVAAEKSRGINAGIIPVIARIASTLYRELEVTDGLAPMPEMSRPAMRVAKAAPQIQRGNDKTIYNVSACPFLSRHKKADARQSEKPVMAMPAGHSVVPASQTWCGLFGKRVLPIVAAAGVAVTAVAALYANSN